MKATSPSKSKRSARKRADGEGTLSQHKTGLWRGRIMVGYKPDGRPDVRSVYAKTQEEARRKLDELRRQHDEGAMVRADATQQTLRAFLQRWLEVVEPNLRLTTWRRYKQLINLHIVPRLGKRKLVKLRPDDLQHLYAAARAAGLAPRTVRQMHAILHRALGQALRWDYVRRNVADAVDAPKFARYEMTPPTPEEIARLIDAAAAQEDRLQALWCVAAFSGCRQGELLGLRWQDLDFATGALHVRQTLLGLDGDTPLFGEPKTANSRRTVSLCEEAVIALREHRQRQLAERLALGPDYQPYGLVFARVMGAPLRARSVIRAFKAALRRAGLREEVRFHDLRHAHATIMLQADVHPKSASARLGHSTIAITMDLYTHALRGLDQDAAERVQRAVRRPGEPGGAAAAD